jgi:predicted transcriptional regulator
MLHRGEIVEQVIRNSGLSITRIAKRLDVTRATMYNYFEDANLNLDTVAAIGKILNYDFPEIFSKANLKQIHTVPEKIDTVNEEVPSYNKKKEDYIQLIIRLDGTKECADRWCRLIQEMTNLVLTTN